MPDFAEYSPILNPLPIPIGDVVPDLPVRPHIPFYLIPVHRRPVVDRSDLPFAAFLLVALAAYAVVWGWKDIVAMVTN